MASSQLSAASSGTRIIQVSGHGVSGASAPHGLPCATVTGCGRLKVPELASASCQVQLSCRVCLQHAAELRRLTVPEWSAAQLLLASLLCGRSCLLLPAHLSDTPVMQAAAQRRQARMPTLSRQGCEARCGRQCVWLWAEGVGSASDGKFSSVPASHAALQRAAQLYSHARLFAARKEQHSPALPDLELASLHGIAHIGGVTADYLSNIAHAAAAHLQEGLALAVDHLAARLHQGSLREGMHAGQGPRHTMRIHLHTQKRLGAARNAVQPGVRLMWWSPDQGHPWPPCPRCAACRSRICHWVGSDTRA